MPTRWWQPEKLAWPATFFLLLSSTQMKRLVYGGVATDGSLGNVDFPDGKKKGQQSGPGCKKKKKREQEKLIKKKKLQNLVLWVSQGGYDWFSEDILNVISISINTILLFSSTYAVYLQKLPNSSTTLAASSRPCSRARPSIVLWAAMCRMQSSSSRGSMPEIWLAAGGTALLTGCDEHSGQRRQGIEGEGECGLAGQHPLLAICRCADAPSSF